MDFEMPRDTKTANEEKNDAEKKRDTVWRTRFLDGLYMGVGENHISQEAAAQILEILKEEDQREKQNTP